MTSTKKKKVAGIESEPYISNFVECRIIKLKTNCDH